MRRSISWRKWRIRPCTGPAGGGAGGGGGGPFGGGAPPIKHLVRGLGGAASGRAKAPPPHPAHALAAGSALPAALVLVEIGDAGHGRDDVGRFVHHDHG